MKVLIADGQSEMAAFLCHEITQWGYEALILGPDEDALEIIENQNCYVVIISITSSDIPTLERINQLKDSPIEVGIIVLNENGSRTSETKIRSIGVLYYMIQPIDMKVLKKILDHLALKMP